ncbi:unnamed protein product [Rhizophagus irregularis]|nr:unnamed protein product [Rhizophagus irregularis]CAB4403626.1 unnamed protein product [Rhizophagus irregularis]
MKIEGSFLLNHIVEELLAESSEYICAFQPTDLMVESNQIVTEFTYLFLFFVNKGDSRLYFKLYILHYSVSTLGIYASSRVI